MKVGDRVEGLYSHKGKKGVIVAIPNDWNWIKVKWDGGKRESFVQKVKLKVTENE